MKPTSSSRAPKDFRYSGTLGQKMDQSALYSAARAATKLALRETPDFTDAQWEAAYDAALENARIGKEAEALLTLFDHFGISSHDKHKWKALSLELARRHVPAFQRGKVIKPGRPRKSKTLNRLSRLYMGNPRPVGRPKNEERTDWMRRYLETIVSDCQENGWRGRGAATTAIRSGLAILARRENRTQAWVRAQLPIWQKDLSRAKRLYPEIAAKLPR